MILNGVINYIFNRLFLWQSLTTLSCVLALRLLSLYRVRAKRFKLFKKLGYPGPEPSLYDGNLSYLLEHKINSHPQLKQKYGKVYGLMIADQPEVFVTDLELLKKIFFDKTAHFKERTFTFVDLPLNDSILFAKFEQWKFARRMMSMEFSNYKVRGDSATEFIEDSIELMLAYIDNKYVIARENNKTADIDMHDLMKATALHMISSMAIKLPDVQVGEQERNVQSLDAFLSISSGGAALWAMRFPILVPPVNFIANNFEYDKTLALIRAGLIKVIRSSLKKLQSGISANTGKGGKPCLIDSLIKLHHQGKLTERAVLGNAFAILFAGYDTTSTTLSYIFWVLGKYPDIQERLRGELKAHGIKSEYLEQVINETMRLYPTVVSFTSRMCTDTVDIDGLLILQGIRVIYHTLLMHHDPDIWPEPKKFDPERFRPGVEHHPCAFAPFGLSDRKCLGYHLAMLEMKMITCDILLRYRLILKSPENLELVSYANVLTKPKEKILLELEKLRD